MFKRQGPEKENKTSQEGGATGVLFQCFVYSCACGIARQRLESHVGGFCENPQKRYQRQQVTNPRAMDQGRTKGTKDQGTEKTHMDPMPQKAQANPGARAMGGPTRALITSMGTHVPDGVLVGPSRISRRGKATAYSLKKA